jgi:hypothetical protein
MPRRTQYSIVERIMILAQRHTQKEIARMLNIGERTVRRWKNEGVQPSTKEREQRLTRAAADERRRVMKGPDALTVKVLPPHQRKGDSTYYDLRRINFQQKVDILKALQERSQYVRLVIRVPVGGTDYRGRKLKDGGYFSSQWEDLSGLTEPDIADLIQKIGDHRFVHQVVTVRSTTKPQRKRRRRK